MFVLTPVALAATAGVGLLAPPTSAEAARPNVVMVVTDAQYRTAHLGKYLNGTPESPTPTPRSLRAGTSGTR